MTNGSQELRFCDRVILWLKLNATKKMNLLMCQLGPLGFGALVGVLRLDLTQTPKWFPNHSSKPSPIPKFRVDLADLQRLLAYNMTLQLMECMEYMGCLMLIHAEPQAFLCHRPWGMGGRDYSHRWWGYFRPLAAWGIFVPQPVCPRALDT